MPSQAKAKSALISSYFVPRNAREGSIRSQEGDQTSHHNGKRPASPEDSLQSKDPKFAQENKKQRMESWKLHPEGSVVTSVNDCLGRQEDSQRTLDRERHQRFRKKLLGEETREGSIGDASDLEQLPHANKRPNEKCLEREGVLHKDEVTHTNQSRHFVAEGSVDKRKASAAVKRQGKDDLFASDGTQYTPLEKQYLEFREANPGVVLCVEVGYKFKFYGDDAHIASRELNIACFKEKHLWTAIVPVHRLHIHIKRLLAAGHKVGVIRQTETRALKAASSNASAPFSRELTELYTASTWVDDMTMDGKWEGADICDPNANRSFVSIVERAGGGSGIDEHITFGLISIQISTGTVTYDQFEDGHMRSQLETRLAHLQPAELLLPPSESISKQTDKVLAAFANGDVLASSSSKQIRIERMKAFLTYNEAFVAASEFYVKHGILQGEKQTQATPGAVDVDKIMSVIIAMPQLAVVALCGAMEYLQSFKLDSVFRLAVNFVSFESRNEILLGGKTLSNLEIFRNNTDGSEKGSLLWLLAAGCETLMGRRLLHRWLSRPLTDITILRQRNAAVQELSERSNVGVLAQVEPLLRGLPDLEKGLARLCYGRATPTELATLLLSLNRVTSEYSAAALSAAPIDSPLIHEAILQLPNGFEVIQKALSVISVRSARNNDKPSLFLDKELFPLLQETKDLIAVVECDLHQHLLELRKFLKVPSLQYATIAQDEYLVEVRTKQAKTVPEDWRRINSTKTHIRYRTPTISNLLKQRDQLKETLDSEAEKAFHTFVMGFFDEHYIVLRQLIASLATLDALSSLAAIARLPGYSRPELFEEGEQLDLEGFRHPMTESLQERYVPNSLSLGDQSADRARALLLTGSNMGGKSSTVRAIALVVVMAQLGSFVPATKASLSIRDAILTRMGASDELDKGRSTFMVEVQETAEIMRTATARSLVILDELGRGTSTHDGHAIAEAVLLHLCNREPSRRPILFFITHFLSLGEWATSSQTSSPLRAMHMAFLECHDADGHTRPGITFLYKLKFGLATKSFGIYCASLAGLPDSLLDKAQRKADDFEARVRDRSTRIKTLSAVALLRPFCKLDPKQGMALIEEISRNAAK